MVFVVLNSACVCWISYLGLWCCGLSVVFVFAASRHLGYCFVWVFVLLDLGMVLMAALCFVIRLCCLLLVVAGFVIWFVIVVCGVSGCWFVVLLGSFVWRLRCDSSLWFMLLYLVVCFGLVWLFDLLLLLGVWYVFNC